MLTKSPSGALSPYYYKGGYFHGIHYGSYFEDSKSLYSMMEKEERFILSSPERRRILMDFYETDLSAAVLEKVARHVEALKPHIIKLAVVTDKKNLRLIRRVLKASALSENGRLYLCTDMEEGKTWLVSDSY